MKVLNIHERELEADYEHVAKLIDSLSSEDELLWPIQCWPRMKFDRPLGVGAKGGHGPIRYVVEAYKPGQSIKFRFTRPKGFNGCHQFDVVKSAHQQSVLLRHTIEMELKGSALLIWPLVIRPLHDALLEDALSTAQTSLGMTPRMRPWSLWVKIIRWIMSGGKAQKQIMPNNSNADDAKSRAVD
ncbi:MAG: SRPBCC family protein [Deltaproteobacteria bacterium]|nr:SRPBCC family protein [Deltaproteobacteria bacterium]